MIDVLIQIGIFATFIIFGVCIWLIKKEKNKGKKAKEKQPIPPTNPKA